MVKRKEGQQDLTGLRGTAQVGSQFRATERESLSANSTPTPTPVSGPQQLPPRSHGLIELVWRPFSSRCHEAPGTSMDSES